MAATTAALETQSAIEDVLSHLTVGPTLTYSKGQTIYGPHHPSNSLYLVLTGKVELSGQMDGNDVALEILRPDEIFGESAFLEPPLRNDQARVLESTKVMAWSVSDVEALVAKRPRLAIALLQVVAQRNVDFIRRIQSFSVDSIERRLARLLLHFAGRLGTPEGDGSVRMMPFTHEMLSRYVGTSREIITHYMTRFRREGRVRYSRRGGIVVYDHSFESLLGNEESSGPAARGAN